MGASRALAKILKLPIIFERVPIQNGLKLYKMLQNGYFFACQKWKLLVKMTAWRVLAKDLGMSVHLSSLSILDPDFRQGRKWLETLNSITVVVQKSC